MKKYFFESMLQVRVCAEVIANSESEAIEIFDNESREYQLCYSTEINDSDFISIESSEASFDDIEVQYTEDV